MYMTCQLATTTICMREVYVKARSSQKYNGVIYVQESLHFAAVKNKMESIALAKVQEKMSQLTFHGVRDRQRGGGGGTSLF